MKTSIKIGAALLLAGILIGTTLPRKAGAQQQSLTERIQSINQQAKDRQAAEAKAVIMYFVYHEVDVVVGGVSVSDGLGAVPVGSNAAVAIAKYKALGLHIDFINEVSVIMSSP